MEFYKQITSDEGILTYMKDKRLEQANKEHKATVDRLRECIGIIVSTSMVQYIN
jgi:hypothetical protein